MFATLCVRILPGIALALFSGLAAPVPAIAAVAGQVEVAVLKEGRRDLTNLNYLMNVEDRDQILRHEKKLLDDWLARELSPSGSH